MICFPNAKINLGLSITEKRSDGMHNIESCFIPIPLFDILEIQPSNRFSIRNYGIPIPGRSDDNLILKAWKLLLSVRNDISPVKVLLYKNIPIGSGLGGGSSDAAFFLTAMNNIFSLGFSSVELQSLSLKVGADCPFFIKNRVSIASGMGNVFSYIENPVRGLHITIVFPNIQISSKESYSKIDKVSNSNLIKVLNNNKSMWKNELKNDFEEFVFNNFSSINTIKDELYREGAIYASLTGSGSAIYALSKKPISIKRFNDKYRVWSGRIE